MKMTYGNMNCDFNGRKRKRAKPKGEVYSKMTKPEFVPLAASEGFRRGQEIQYASVGVDVGRCLTGRVEPKRAVGHTVAIAYNKGGYMVIPDSEVEHIGK